MGIKEKIIHPIILLSMSFMLIQCKSYELQVKSSVEKDISFVPTLVVDTLTEHQYESNNSEELKRVEITKKINVIPQWAFAIGSSIEEVRLSSSVKEVDDNAFFSCKNLTKINLNHVEVIGENCFKFSAIEDVNLAETHFIKDFAFSNCQNLKQITFSEKTDSIGEFAFYADTALVSCNIPAGKIGNCAFMECTNLQQLTLGDVPFIGKAAFLGCKNLKKITLNSPNTIISEDAFEKDIIIIYKK